MSDEPSWMDQVLAVPAIGIITAPWLAFASGIWDSLERLGDRWSDGTRITARGPTGVRVERGNGTYLDLSPANLVFGHSHQMHIRERPGALPVLDSGEDARPYSELLNELLEDASAIITDTLGSGTRTVVRIGVHADCRLVEGTAPPGIEAFINSLATMWSKPLKVADANFVLELDSKGTSRDQCHHGISKNEYDRPLDLRLKLDWQRVWTPPVRMARDEVRRELTKATEAATAYFAGVGVDGGPLCNT